MDDILQKQIALVQKLYDLTLAKKLDWQSNDYEGRIETRLADLYVSLAATDHEGTPFEVINIWRNGDLIESINDGLLPDPPKNGDFPTYWDLMVALRELAERQASKIEQTLDTLLDALEAVAKPKQNKSFDSDLDDDVPF